MNKQLLIIITLLLFILPFGINAQNEFITTWQTTVGGETITIPTFGTGYNYTVDWGDGMMDTGQTGSATHAYATAGIYTVMITGDFPRIVFNNGGDKDKILTIEQWGNIAWTDMTAAFLGCSNLTYNASDIPDLSACTSLAQMFSNTGSFNGNIDNWDVSTITTMANMFQGASVFNSPLNSWNVSNVTNMSAMFSSTSSFNQPLNNWDVSNVTVASNLFSGSVYNGDLSGLTWTSLITAERMFWNNSTFNQPIDSWGPSLGNLTNCFLMFTNTTSFDQPLNSWDVSSVTNMHAMFTNATSFNQPLNNWNVSSVTTAISMFEGATAFNGDMSGLTWTSLTNATSMFKNAISFNQPIDSWGASLANVTNMTSMFQGATAFNQPLNSWDVSSVTQAVAMFSSATSFDQSLNNWNVSNLLNASNMFSNTIFDQDISSWTLVSLTSAERMFWNNAVFNQDLTAWAPYMGTVSNFLLMFANASSFNQDLGAWDMTGATNVSAMLTNSGLDIPNYDSTLIGWATQSLNSNLDLGADNLEYCQGEAARQSIIDSYNWTFTNDLKSAGTTGNETYLGCVGDGYSVTVNGMLYDENNPTGTEVLVGGNYLGCDSTVNINLTFQAAPTATITNSGYTLPITLDASGSTGTGSLTYLWSDNITTTPTFNATVSGTYSVTVTDAASGCTAETSFVAANGFITTWETTTAGESITFPTAGSGFNYTIDWGDGTVETLTTGNPTHTYTTAGTYTVSITGDFPGIDFGNSTAANRDKIISIDQWGDIQWTSLRKAFQSCSNLIYNATDAPDLSNVTNLDFMFHFASLVDGDLSNWDVSTITSMMNMFSYAPSFNGDISNWDVSNVTNMANMFTNASSFNIDLSAWNVGMVTTMASMFRNTSFNMDISGWNTASVTTLYAMFWGNSAFNQNIGAWNTSNVTSTAYMFYQATAFNQDLNTWDVSMVTDMSRMFYAAISFNGNISNWDVSMVTNMQYMFAQAVAFNQDISGWNIVNVTDLSYMFSSATSFNQNLGGWNISNVTDMTSMLGNSGLDIPNYDATLIGWDAQTVNPNVSLGSGGLEYCQGAIARDQLINLDGWTITGDSQNTGTTGNETYLGCVGDGYNVVLNGNTYDESSPTGTEIIPNYLGCDSTITINLTFQAVPTATLTSPATELNNATPSITLDASTSSGTPTITYEWDDASTNPTLTVNTANTYTVTVTDGNGCTSTDQIVITQYLTSYTTIASGNWNDPSIWDNGMVPPEPIPSDVTVNILHATYLNFGDMVTNFGTINVEENTGGFPDNGALWMSGSTITNEAGGVINFNAQSTFSTFSGDNTIINNNQGGTININSSSLNLGCFASNPNTTAINNAGDLNIDAGDLQVCGVLDNTATGQITTLNNSSIQQSGTINNAGTIDLGTSTSTVNSGSINSTSGTINNAGFFYAEDGGTHAPGTFNNTGIIFIGNWSNTIATYNFTDNLNLNGVVRLDIQGNTAGTTYDQITVDGDVDVTNAVMDFNVSYDPPVGTVFDILTSTGTVTGPFADVNGGLPTCDKALEFIYNANSIQAVVVELSLVLTPPASTEITCSNPTITLDASTSSGPDRAYYQWYAPGAFLGDTDMITVDSASTYTVYLIDTMGFCFLNTNITITKDTLEPIIALATPSTLLDCNTTSITLDASGSTGQGAISYLWSDNSTAPTLSVTTPGTYMVTITDADNDCVKDTSIVIMQDIATPTATVTNPSSVIDCNTTSITLDASSSTGQGALTYLWDDASTNSTLTVTTANTYNVTVTDVNGCSDIFSVVITDDLAAPTPIINSPTTVLDCNTTSITLDASASSGQGALSYEWDNASTNPTLTVTTPNTYSVTVTDINGCSAIISETITQDIATPTATLNSTTNVLDCTTTSITLDASTSTGQGALSYLWDDASTNSTLTVTTPNTYNVTVTDINGCTDITSVAITQNIAAPTASITSATTILDCDVSSIALDASGSTGQGALTYLWDDNSTNAILNVTTPNTYNVTITDINGCTDITSVTITQDLAVPTLNLTTTASELNCNTLNAIIDASTSTGQGAISYLWNDNSTNASLTINGPGTYSVTITDANGCTAESNQIITQDIAAPTANIASPTTSLDCGITSITLDASGSTGQSTLSYLWNDASTNATLSVSIPSSYTVTITDSDNGCTSEETLIINENILAPTANLTSPTTILDCAVSAITIDASTSTSQGALSYLWSDNSTNTTLTVSNTGTYSVTITDTNACTAIGSTTITQDLAIPTVNLTTTSTEFTCTIQAISIDASTSTGQGSLDYLWSSGEIDPSIDITTAGNYTVTITDSNGCTAESTQVIADNTFAPTATIDSPTTELNCTTTSITLDAGVSTGLGTLSYLWSDNSTNATLNVNNIGTYTVTVTDTGNNCTAIGSTTITEDIAVPTASIVSAATELNCTTTSITLDANTSTGQGALTYLWSDNSTNATLDITTPNTYGVTVTDVNGCSATNTVTISQDITTPTANISNSFSELTCATTSIILNASTSTGQGTLTYLWSDNSTNATLEVTTPNTYEVTVTDVNGCSATTSTTITQAIDVPNSVINSSAMELNCNTSSINLDASASTGQGTLSFVWSNNSTFTSINVTTPNTYSVTVTDSNGCSSINSITITENLAAPTPFINSPETQLNCNSTSITLDATSSVGQGTLTYLWSDNSTNATLNVSTPNTYSLTITDVNGCTAESNTTITEDIATPTTNISSPTTELNCSTTSINIDASSSVGQGALTYLWSDNSSNTSLDVNTPNTYSVTVTDVNGCTSTSSLVITENLATPTADISNTETELTCAITTISLDASTSIGQGALTYLWDDASTNPTLAVTTPNTYNVTVTDVNGCTSTTSSTITQATDLPTANLNSTTTELNCTTTSINIDASTSTGQGTLSFLWSDSSTGSSLTITSPNTYSLTVTDENGCSSNNTITITENSTTPTANLNSSSTVLDCTTTSITLDASTSTGQGALSYLWSDGTMNASLDVGTPNIYSVTVTDVNGCTETNSVTITQNTIAPTATIVSADTELTCATPSITLDASTSAGQGALTYLWSDGTTNATLDVNTPATYSVTVTDVNGCSAISSTTISQSTDLPTVNLSVPTITLSCDITNITIDASASNGSGILSFLWSDGSTNPNLDVSTPDTYSVTVTDENGCSAANNISIVQDADVPTANLSSSATELNCNTTTITLDASTSSGQGILTYLWSDGSTNAMIDVSSPNTYNVTVTDINGCTATNNVTISQNIIIPSASILATDTELTCVTTSITLDASTSTGQDVLAFLWSNGSTTSTLDVTIPDTYAVTVTDSNGCISIDNITITSDDIIPTISLTSPITELDCTNTSTTLDASTSTGQGTLSYLWSDGSSNSTLDINSPGNYAITITDSNGCSVTDGLTITQDIEVPVVTITNPTTELTCTVSTITLDASTSTGQGILSFLWSDGSTNPTIDVTTPATYTVTVTTINGCSAIGTSTISQDTSTPIATIDSPTTELDCNISDITLDASASTGQGALNFLWSTGSTDPTILVNNPSTYSVTITNENGCTSTISETITLNLVTPTVDISTPSTVINCNFPSVTLDANSSVGQGTLSYEWSDGSTNPALEVSEQGTYWVLITDTNGCANIQSITITQNEVAPIANITSATTELNCSNTSLTLDANTSTGQGALDFLWSDGSTNSTLTVNTPADYSLTVTDINGCTSANSVTVSQDNLVPSLQISALTNQLNCANTTIDLEANSTANPDDLNYLWSNGSTDAVLTVNTIGTYSVTITNANGCTAEDDILIIENFNPPTADLTSSDLELSCDITSIILDASFSFGQGAISYEWPDGSTDSTLEIFTSGTYTVIVSTPNGCTDEASITIGQDISATIADIQNSATELNCATNSITLDASTSTGQGALTYLWSDGSTSSSIAVDTPNDYTVTVTAENGCTSLATSTISENSIVPTPSISSPTTEIDCINTAITLDASSSTSQGLLTYLWSDGSTSPTLAVNTSGDYSVTITDENSCTAEASVSITENNAAPTASVVPSSNELNCTASNISLDGGTSSGQGVLSFEWSDGSTNSNLVVTTPDTYVVTVTDINGCTAAASTTIEENIEEPTITINSPSTELNCAMTSIVMDASSSTGQGTLSYAWSDGSTGPTLDVTIPATYFVIATDINGCTAQEFITITEDASVPSATINNPITTIDCNNSSINLDASSSTGQGVLTFLWSDGSTGATLIVNEANDYSVTVTDTNGCTDESMISIQENIADPTVNLQSSATELDCSNNTITLDASASAGQGFLTYLWSNGNTTPTIAVNTSGDYSVTITDVNGCTNEENISISENTTMPTAAINNGGGVIGCTNSSITLDASSSTGQGTLTYVWSDGSTSSTTDVTIADTYTVTVTDTNGCTAETSTVVTADSSVPTVSLTSDFTELDCTISSVTLDASSSSGQGVLTYLWSDNSTNANIVVNTSGDYSVTITDINGCIAEESISITENFTAPTATLISNSNELNCAFASITLDASNSVSTGALNYLWLDGSTDATLEITAQGTYTVTITDSNGCTDESSIDITKNVLEPTLIIDAPTTELTCANNTLSLDAGSLSVGQGALTYEWSNTSTNQILAVSSSGIYSVTITDINGCTATDDIEVTSNIVSPTATINSNTTILSCNNLSIDLDASSSSGQGTLTYEWSSGTTDPILIVNTAASYTVTITDSNGCTEEASITITEETEAPTVTINSSNDEIDCDNQTITLDASSSTGQGLLSFEWSDGSTANTLVVNTEGTYTVTVTDSNDCSSVNDILISENIAAPTPNILSSSTELNCEFSSVTLDASSSIGQGALSYQWSDGSSNETLEVSGAGNYEVTITDVNGCTATTSTTLTENFIAPTVDIDYAETELNCSTISIPLDAGSLSSGQGTLSYQWSEGSTDQILNVTNAGNYVVTVTDVNGCTGEQSVEITQDLLATTINLVASETELSCTVSSITLDASTSTGQGGLSYQWSDGSTNPSTTINSAGIYTVTVTDGTACTDEETITIEQAPIAIALIETTEPTLTCAITSITLNASNSEGSGTLSFEWSDGSSNSTLDISTPATYFVTVTDENNCEDIASIVVTENTLAPTAMIDAPSTEIDCNFSSIVLDASGSTAQGILSYEWSDGTTSASLSVENAGDYSVTITDSNGCSAINSISITENSAEPSATISTAETELNCSVQTITLDAIGSTGQGTLSYEWSDASNTSSLVVNSAGDYSVTVTDINGCTSTNSITITNDPYTPTAAIVNSTTVLTCDINSISLDASSSTGQGTLTYVWSDGSTNANNIVNSADTYTVTISDALGCTATNEVIITENITAPTAAINSPSTELNCSTTSINLDASASSGQGALSYEWSDASTGSSLVVNSTGDYSVTITDVNGCTDNETISISDVAPTTVATINSSTTILTCPNSVITLDASASSGQGLLSYLWSNGATGTTLDITDPADYSVTITDAIGCTAEETISITENLDIPTANLDGLTDILLGEDLTITEIGTGAIAWEWSGPNGFSDTGSNTITITNTTATNAGTYSVVITNTSGCTAEASININIIPLTASAGNDVTICEGESLTLEETGIGATIWTWTDIDGTFIANGQNLTIAPVSTTDAGSYIVVVENGAGSMLSDTVDVFVNALPVANISGSNILCAEQDIALSEDGGNAIAWLWSGPNGFSSTDSNASVPTAGTLSSGMYSVTITDANSCTNETSISVTVNELPTVAINSNAPLCDGLELNLEATGSAVSSWNWTTPNGVLTGETIIIPDADVSAAGDYTLVVEDANGCQNSATSTVEIYALPSVSLSTNAPLCLGSTLTLEETTGQASSYNWTGPNGFTDSNPNPSIDNAQLENAGSYTLSITDANSCVNEASIAVVVNALPVPDIFTSAPICDDEDLEFAETSGTLTQWTWTSPSGQIFNTQDVLIEQQDVEVGTYTFTGVDNNNCSISSDITVTIVSGEDIESNFLVGSTACTGDTVHLIEYSELIIDPSIVFSWDFGDGNTSNERDPLHKYETSGLYNISLDILSGACPNISLEKTITVTECYQEGDELVHSELFPSINNGLFNITVEADVPSDLLLQIFDIKGQQVYEEFFDNVEELQKEILLQDKGIYTIQIGHQFGVDILRTIVID